MLRTCLTALVISLLCLTACDSGTSSAPTKGVLTIGVDLPLTGLEGRAATQALNGVRFFAQQHPTLEGFEVALSVTDDAQGGSPSLQLGIANVRRLLADRSLIALIGPFDSSVARAEIPIANAAGLAMISPATANSCLTKEVYVPAGLNPARTAISCKEAGFPSAADLRPTGINNYFRLSTTDDLQGPAAADYAYRTLHVLRAAVLSDHEAYGQALADAFTARFERLGGLVVSQVDLNPAASPDLASFFKRVKADGARAIYFGGATSSGACAARASMAGIFEGGEATPFLGGDGIAQDPLCVQQAGANASGIYATVPSVDASSRASASATIAAFKTAFGDTADYGPSTMAAYDAAAVVYAAIGRAVLAAGGEPPVRGNVISQLSITTGFAGATGSIGFDGAGDTTNRVVSIYEPAGTDSSAPWKLVDAVDYSAALPY